MGSIPYGHQDVNDDDIQAVIDVLKSDFLTQGPSVEQFEKAVAAYTGAKYAVAVCNATAALHLCCLAMDFDKEDVLWTSPNTFVASANCALYCGGSVDFVDIDSDTFNLSSSVLEEKLIRSEKNGSLPKIVIPVHFGGQSCEMDRIKKLSVKYGFKIIEDASHAVGGKYRDKPIGSCQFSDATVFSFHPVKVMTAGEGGMILTNDPQLYDRLLRLRTHGITRNKSLFAGPSHGPWYYEQIDLGFNYRITDIQAALGKSQLKRLDKFVDARHKLVKLYNESFDGIPLKTQKQNPETYSAYHLYALRIEMATVEKSKSEVFEFFHSRGINVNLHYIPVYLQPYYKALGFKEGLCPEAESYYKEAVTLPLFSNLTKEDQFRVISAMKEVFSSK